MPTGASNVYAVPLELRFDRWYLLISRPLGIGPKTSELRVDGGELHVKMGWAFAADIPLTSITKAEAARGPVYAAGVHFFRDRWLVNGSRKGLVELSIAPPARAKMWRMSMPVGALVLSVTDPDALIAACTAWAP